MGRSTLVRSSARTILGWLAKVSSWVWFFLTGPIRLFLTLRSSMTAASVTLLLVGIVSANIIWGYPWIGVFSACSSLFLVGFVVNRWSLPKLEADFVLPRLAVAGTPFQATAILTNQSRIPAMELQVALEGTDRNRKANSSRFETLKIDGSIDTIFPAQHQELRVTLLCKTRGLHPLPQISVTTWFPFYLFNHTRSVETDESIAVTPRLLESKDDSIAGGLLDSLGNWTRKLLSGDTMDYTGSREYEPGMPVRRWDFSSWARLGKPIIREYQSPSVRTVTLIIDTAIDPDVAVDREIAKGTLEYVLSCAATAIDRVCRQPIQVQLFLTGQDGSIQADRASDRESLLIRLATADCASCGDATDAIGDLCKHFTGSPLLIITSRANPLGHHSASPSVSILRIDREHGSKGQHHQNQKDLESVQLAHRP